MLLSSNSTVASAQVLFLLTPDLPITSKYGEVLSHLIH